MGLLAPMFSTDEFTSAEILYIYSIFSKLQINVLSFSNSLYCLIRLLSGSFSILLKSSSFKAFNSTLIGSLPCSSGSRSEGFANWKAPEAIKSI